MSLRTRTTVVVLLATLLPALGIGAWARATIVAQTRAEYERRLSATVSSARLRVEERYERDAQIVGALCERDPMTTRVVEELASQRFSPQTEDDLRATITPSMRALGTDSLSLVDGSDGPDRGRVLASAHFPDAVGTRDPDLVDAVLAARSRWFLRDERVRDANGSAVTRPLLVSSCVARRGRVLVLAVAGRRMDAAFTESLLGDVSPVVLALSGPPGEGRGGVAARDVWTFLGGDGRPRATLVASLDDGPLRDQLDALDRGFLVAALATLAVAVLFSILLAFMASRPLSVLEHAASRVASGDLDATLVVDASGEVGRALGAFNHMTRELRVTREKLIRAERIAAWRDIARRIAHEIKNPLSPIQVSIETLRKTYAVKHPEFDEIFDESTRTILEEVDRLKKIVSEFSNFARLPRPRPALVDVREVAQNVVSLHVGGDVQVAYSPPATLTPILADREQLTQVVVNLVQNGADAARAKHGPAGHVTLSLRDTPGGVVLDVDDDGPGVPADLRTKIFEPYFTTKVGGTGLGLAIAHRIVTDHGGNLEVLDAPSGGARFRVELPREGPPLEADASRST